ncbi:hypothetical protein [Endozoicomonas sp. GU-1]|uniref:hypothetical protein n=1 Tax=Endozoicomonas sp. GU-1 TaxID=3009078 RepID=UPI0022B366C9|nr:hypothetical protein [Endozoicomonas sp. GU-1]WBA82200.1 hypothetical protein O2T12_03300 [Endozoicomonas sp. GU-1]WBA85140.1 hypothetical protein O3276_18010 [Endozoicomonas sp. GU-1]
MEALAVKTAGSRNLIQPGPAGEGGRLQRARAWVWDVCVPVTKKLLPVVGNTYREHKTWCERLGGVGVIAGIGLYTGMISLPAICYLGGGFAAGALYYRGPMREESNPGVTSSDPPPTLPGLSGDGRCSKHDIVALMKVLDDLLMNFSDLNARVDALTAERTMAAVNRLNQEASRKKKATEQGLPDDVSLREALQIACVIRPRIFLTLLHELSGVSSAGEDVGKIVNKILGETFHNPCTEIRRTRRADYEQLADAFLESGKAGSQGKRGRPVSQKVQVDILHGITAPWTIADEGRAQEVMHKIDKVASLALYQWKAARKDADEGRLR